jgi:hypothetical protein
LDHWVALTLHLAELIMAGTERPNAAVGCRAEMSRQVQVVRQPVEKKP